MSKSVLMTGGTGFIGSHLVDELLKNDYKVFLLSHAFSDPYRIKSHLDKVKFYYVDKGETEKAFKENRIDYMIHLATKYIKNHQSIDEVNEMVQANVVFPTRLCELCVRHQVRYFINTGTFFEYEMKDSPIKESDRLGAYNYYAATKLAFIEMLKYYVRDFDFHAVDFKLFPPFGDRDNEKLMAFLVKSIIQSKEVEMSGGEQMWNFTYVKDIVQAYLLALAKFEELNGYEVFNIGYDEAVSIKEVVNKFEMISGKKMNVKWGAKLYPEKEIFYVSCDNLKLRSLLGWEPKYGIDKGLEATYNYFNKKYG